MSVKEQTNIDYTTEASGEAGQTIVLIAFMIIGLLAFVGLAADTGFLFARSSQFSSAVDAAALAGAVDLHQGGTLDLVAATSRAGEFLNANGWPIAQAISVESSSDETDLGIPEFSYTVTWPVQTFFMGLLGFDEIPITRSSTAAYYALTDMPIATQFDRSMVRLGNQYIYGPNSCTGQGDPVSSPYSDAGEANPDYPVTNGIYEYRIRIPDDFITDTNQSRLTVQLFDPDTVNLNESNGATVDHSNGEPAEYLSCNSGGRGDSCLINTGEPGTGNPVWLVRVDETWKPRAADPAAACPERDLAVNNGNGTFTRYELFYRDANGTRIDIATFASNPSNSTQTDMKWVTPGVDIAAQSGSFNVNLNPIPLDDDKNYNLYLHVSTTGGTSKNGWDIWAGPTETDFWSADDMPAGVNERNLEILANPGLGRTYGAEVYAQGYLPMTIYRPGEITLPIAAVEAVQGGGTIYASVFDFEAGDPFYYGFDTLASGDLPAVNGAAVCPGVNSADCNNKWVRPQHIVGIPTNSDDIAFYGGFLTVRYNNTSSFDEHVWSVRVTAGRPFLTR